MTRWEWLERQVQGRGLSRGAELGVKEGRTLFHLLDRCPGLSMIAVDLWAPSGDAATRDWPHADYERAVRARAAGYGNRVELLKMSTREAADVVAVGSLDFVFIDADHATAAVMADIAAWRPKLRPGGLLCGDDAGWRSVRAALDWAAPGWVQEGRCWRA